ncbi:hypothetical protein BGX30_006712, partial [Mortierella sp. GBA39]
MTELERTLNYSGKWQDDVKFVFERLGPYSMMSNRMHSIFDSIRQLRKSMRDEVSARDEGYSRKAISPPSDRKTNL